MTTEFKQVGWIGLGQMGVPMVNRLLAHDIEVGVFNRNIAKCSEFAEKGAKCMVLPLNLSVLTKRLF
ncbi:3-hydroxyacid dehydrogenase [Actinobacillus equuli]|nr:3-hydroxyacid dehydrogenase [Actinobacillus equuli]